MKKYFETSKEAHKVRDERSKLTGQRLKVFKVRGKYLVGTDSDWLLAVS